MNFLRLQPLAWLPNTHGFPFRAIDKQGNMHKCRVVLDPATNTYKIEGANYADLTGWYRNG